MVLQNQIAKDEGHHSSKGRKPKNLLFKVDGYDVSLHKPRGVRAPSYFHCAIWHRDKRIGTIDLSVKYTDMRSVAGVSTNICVPYQGKGIAHRVYETLVCDHGMTLHSDNQSPGAIKLWKRMGANRSMRIYFVEGFYQFYRCDVFEINVNGKGDLRGTDYSGKSFDPYKKSGGLLLVKKGSSMDKMLQSYIPIRKGQSFLQKRFSRYDHWKGI